MIPINNSSTPQEVFTFVSNHLLTQMKKSKGIWPEGSTGCSYRSPEGLKCAVGCLIPNNIYSETMEGQGVAEIISRPGMYFLNAHQQLLEELQYIHDMSPPISWSLKLKDLANRFNLSFTPPNNQS